MPTYNIIETRVSLGVNRQDGKAKTRRTAPMTPPQQCAFLTTPESFRDVSRGNPVPHRLKGDDLVKARLTPVTWRLEIVSDGTSQVEKPRRLEDDTAIDLPTLHAIAQDHSIKFMKGMQCLNIPQPLGQGVWE